MRVINVKNESELYLALKNPQDNDTIVIGPGEFFSSTKPAIFTLNGSLTIIGEAGQEMTSTTTMLNCSLNLGANANIHLEDLSLSCDLDETSVISLHDGAKLYAENIFIERSLSNWTTIDCQNSSIFLKKSSIQPADREDSVCINLENSQLISILTEMHIPYLNNSTAYLKNSHINNTLILKNNSHLSFTNLSIEKDSNFDKGNLIIQDNSSVIGEGLTFYEEDGSVVVNHSKFENSHFKSDFTEIKWFFDDDSTVLADGHKLINKNI